MISKSNGEDRCGENWMFRLIVAIVSLAIILTVPVTAYLNRNDYELLQRSALELSNDQIHKDTLFLAGLQKEYHKLNGYYASRLLDLKKLPISPEDDLVLNSLIKDTKGTQTFEKNKQKFSEQRNISFKSSDQKFYMVFESKLNVSKKQGAIGFVMKSGPVFNKKKILLRDNGSIAISNSSSVCSGKDCPMLD